MRPPGIDGPLRVLGVIAAPKGRAALNVHKEKVALESAMKSHLTLNLVELDWITGRGTSAQILHRFRRESWHVVHFIGHGGFDDKQKMGVLAFEDSSGGEHCITAGALRGLLGGKGIRLVVLNACRGAYSGVGGLFTSIAARLAQTIPAVVAMQTAISDKSALEFSNVLYECLVQGLPLERAVTETRISLQSLPSRAIEWPAPVLYLSTTQDILNLQTVKGEVIRRKRSRNKHALKTSGGGKADVGPIQRPAARKRVASDMTAMPVFEKRPAPEDDPQKYQWGGLSEMNGRKLSAKVRAVDKDWYRIDLLVVSKKGYPKLRGPVEFHLHDSFPDPVRTVTAREGKAKLSLVAYGAFTVGVKADGGNTRLELDLSELPGAPPDFKEH